MQQRARCCSSLSFVASHSRHSHLLFRATLPFLSLPLSPALSLPPSLSRSLALFPSLSPSLARSCAPSYYTLMFTSPKKSRILFTARSTQRSKRCWRPSVACASLSLARFLALSRLLAPSLSRSLSRALSRGRSLSRPPLSLWRNSQPAVVLLARVATRERVAAEREGGVEGRGSRKSWVREE